MLPYNIKFSFEGATTGWPSWTVRRSETPDRNESDWRLRVRSTAVSLDLGQIDFRQRDQVLPADPEFPDLSVVVHLREQL